MRSFRILLIPLGSVEPVNVLSKKDTLIRLHEGLIMWSAECWDYVLVTGGAFTKKSIMTRPGSEVMAEWLIDHGVPKGKIIVENESRDTYQNVKYSIRKIQELVEEGEEFEAEILVVTQWQHAIRFYLTFRSYGVRVRLKKLHYAMGVVGILREFVLIALTAVDPKGKIVGLLNQRLFRQNR